MAQSAKSAPSKISKKHHYFRTIVAALLGVFALNLIILSITLYWTNYTFTNTDKFVKTVAPLAKNEDVQNFVVDSLSKAILENKDINQTELAQQLFIEHDVQSRPQQEIAAELKSTVEESIKTVVDSEVFYSLWESTIRNIHSQFISQLENGDSEIKLDLNPIMVGVVDELDKTKLSVVSQKLEIDREVGEIKLSGEEINQSGKTSPLSTITDLYDIFERSIFLILAFSVAFLILAITISVNHLKTSRRILLGIGISAGVFAIILSAPAVINVNSADALQQKMALAVVEIMTKDLKTLLITISIVCISISVGSKIYEIIKRHRQVIKKVR